MPSSEFEILIRLKKNWKKTQRSEKPFLFKKGCHCRYGSLKVACVDCLTFPSKQSAA
jgi:hypothetical protein